MKRWTLFLGIVALALAAAGAGAEPMEFDDPAFYATDLDMGVVGGPVRTGSWNQTFVIRGTLPRIETSSFYIAGGMDRIKILNPTTTTWELPNAISSISAYPYQWPGANTETWCQTLATPTVARVDGHTDDGGSDNGLGLACHFAGDPQPCQFEMQIFAKCYDNNDGSCLAYYKKQDYDLKWDGCSWWYSDHHDECDWKPCTPCHHEGQIPEPLSMAFLGSAFLGVVGFGAWRRRREGVE